METLKAVKDITLNNCRYNVINIACQNVKTVMSGTKQRTGSDGGRIVRSRPSRSHFVMKWMEHHAEGLDRVADATGMSAYGAWVKYSVLVASGVGLPSPGGHNPFEISSAEIARLNDLIRTSLS